MSILKALVLTLLLFSNAVFADFQSTLSLANQVDARPQIDIVGLRYIVNAQKNQLVFDLTAPTQYRVFTMNNPSRLIIDIKNAHLKQDLIQPEVTHPLFDRVRAGLKNDTDLRIVVDLKLADVATNLVFSANVKDARHLVIELFNQEANVASKNETPKVSQAEDNKKITTKPQETAVAKMPNNDPLNIRD